MVIRALVATTLQEFKVSFKDPKDAEPKTYKQFDFHDGLFGRKISQGWLRIRNRAKYPYSTQIATGMGADSLHEHAAKRNVGRQ